MAQINLLPWREEARQERKKEFLTVIGGMAVVSAGLIVVAHVYIAMIIGNQESRNNILKEEIRVVEAKIKEIKDLERKKEQLVARMRVIEQLQSNRPEVVHLFDEFARLVPEGLYLSSLDQKARTITLAGYAQSNARVSALMRGLENSKWFEAPRLDVISTKNSGKAADMMREFKLTVKQTGQDKEARR